MARVRMILGLAAGLFLILSSAAHSILGWKQLDGELARTNVSPELALGLKFGWQFAGVAMLTFGAITLVHFIQRLRGEVSASLPIILIAVAYISFGTIALLASRDAFFVIFLIPGLLLALGSTARPLADGRLASTR